MKLKWQIIILFQAAVEIFLGFVITKFNILPLKYLIVVYLVLFLIFRLMYKFIKPPKRIGKHAKKSRRARLGKYVSLLVSIAMIFSSYMLIKTNGAIAKMTGMSEQKTVIALVAREFDSCLQFFTNQIAQNVDYINAFEFFYCQIRENICTKWANMCYNRHRR